MLAPANIVNTLYINDTFSAQLLPIAEIPSVRSHLPVTA